MASILRVMRYEKLVGYAAGLGAALSLQSSSLAYTNVMTSEGAITHWETNEVTLQRDATMTSQRLTSEQVDDALNGAIAAWAAMPESKVMMLLGKPTVDTSKSIPTVNIVRFRHDAWPYDHNMLAYTQLFTHPSTGQIVAATIEVNEQDHHFTVGTTKTVSDDRYDLQAVLTHELGHVLGLGHSTDGTATMFPSTAPYDDHQRVPDSDDRSGISSIYADMQADGSFTNGGPTGSSGMASTAQGCSATGHSSNPGSTGLAILLGVAFFAIRLRSRKS